MVATSPLRSTSRTTSLLLKRDRGRPRLAGSTQAMALADTTTSGGKSSGTTRARAFLQTRYALLEETLAPLAHHVASDIAVLADPDPPLGLEKLLETHPALIAFDFLPHATALRDVEPFTVHVLNCDGAWLELECHRAFEWRGFLRGAPVAQ
ncbi:MAG: hypothetical protein ACHQ9S_15855 [Candidatus Binatia bacterium]